MQTKKNQTAGQLLVRSLVNQDVKFIFGIPGGKIMPTFDVLNDEGPKIIVCRHEQNAAFMAAAVGRLTGRPGVCLVRSGPGTSNLVTGAATATSEGDPMVAIGGVVAQPEALKQTHQVHPLNYIIGLRSLVDDDTIVANDMGSHHIWTARHFFEFEPRKLLISNGQQTLGVGIPWAMADFSIRRWSSRLLSG